MAELQTPNRYLCVGGPLDGQMIMAQSANGFRVPVRDGLGACDVAYRAETFITGDGALFVWVPDGQTLIRTMERLLEHYSPRSSDGDCLKLMIPTIGVSPKDVETMKREVLKAARALHKTYREPIVTGPGDGQFSR